MLLSIQSKMSSDKRAPTSNEVNKSLVEDNAKIVYLLLLEKL